MSKTALSALLSRLNTDNPSLPTPLTSSNCTFGTPTALSGDPSGKDTSVSVAGTGTPYTTDSVTLKYNRVSLSTLLGSSSPDVIWTTQASSSDLLSAFNALVGTNLTVNDIVVESLPTKSPGNNSYSLKANAASLAFDGAAALVLQYTAPVSFSGSFNTAGLWQTGYSSSMSLIGGNGVFSSPLVASGQIPPGTSLSISGSNLVLSGTPTTTGSYSFTVMVNSNGQSATTTTQSVVVTANMATALSNPISTGLVTSDATSGKSPSAMLYTRINADNTSMPVTLSSSNSSFGTPTALSGDASGKDTSVVVTGSSPYSGTQTVKYNRINLTTLLGANSPDVAWTTQTSSSDLLSWYNTLTGANLSTSDIVVEALPTMVSGNTNYSLKANASSLAYEGSVTVVLQNTPAALTLNGLFTPNATNLSNYSSSVTISGGVPPYSNPIVTSGKFGTGLALSISGSTLTLSGKPTATNYGFATVQVQDSQGTTTSATYTTMNASYGSYFSSSLGGYTKYNFTNASLTATRNDAVTATAIAVIGTVIPTPLKGYIEVVFNNIGGAGTSWYVGYWSSTGDGTSSPGTKAGTNSVSYETASGAAWMNGVSTAFGTTFTTGDTMMIAYDASNMAAVKFWFGKNGTWIQGNPATGTGAMLTANWSSSATFYPAFSTPHGTNGGAPQGTYHVGMSTQTYTPPAGFAAGMP